MNAQIRKDIEAVGKRIDKHCEDIMFTIGCIDFLVEVDQETPFRVRGISTEVIHKLTRSLIHYTRTNFLDEKVLLETLETMFEAYDLVRAKCEVDIRHGNKIGGRDSIEWAELLKWADAIYDRIGLLDQRLNSFTIRLLGATEIKQAIRAIEGVKQTG